MGEEQEPFEMTPELLEQFESAVTACERGADAANQTPAEGKAVVKALVELARCLARVPTVTAFEGMTSQRFGDIIRPLLAHKHRGVRSAALRTLRYSMKDIDVDEIVSLVTSHHLHIYLTRSLERPKDYEMERMEALKAIRRMIDVNALLVPRSCACALVALAEHGIDFDPNATQKRGGPAPPPPPDPFQSVALETLCELSVRNTQLSARCGAIRVICLAIINPQLVRLQKALILTLLFVLNCERTRRHVRPATQIEIILSPFTEVLGDIKRTPDDAPLWRSRIEVACTAVVALCRSWVGIMCLADDTDGGVKALVQTLRLEPPDVRRVMLRTLYQPKDRESVDTSPAIRDARVLSAVAHQHDLLSNYAAATLLVFVDAGLLEALVDVGRQGDAEESELCMKLLAELLTLATKLLPPVVCAKLQSLPALVQYATEFSQSSAQERARASTMLSNLRLYSKASKEYYGEDRTSAGRPTDAVGKDSKVVLERIENLKLKMDLEMDAQHFNQQLKASGVVEGKNFRKWNWDLIIELLEGSMQNPDHFHAGLKTKFFKRLLSFYKPQKNLFWTQSRSSEAMIHVRTGCMLLTSLLNNSEGRAYLEANELFPQLGAILKAETSPDPDSGSGQRILSPDNLERTMSREYFVLLGHLSRTEAGRLILTRNKIWSWILSLAKSTNHAIPILLITQLDFSTDGLARSFLQKCLTDGPGPVRLHATRHLLNMLRSNISEFADWGVGVLTAQLYDPDPPVARAALEVLDSVCDLPEAVESLIARRPAIPQLGRAGKSLMQRMMARPHGMAYLQSQGIVEPELDVWFHTGVLRYVMNLELALAQAMSDLDRDPDVDEAKRKDTFVFGTPKPKAPSAPVGSGLNAGLQHRAVSILPPPTHIPGTSAKASPVAPVKSYATHFNRSVPLFTNFYAQLVKTPEGVDLLKASRHYLFFSGVIATYVKALRPEVESRQATSIPTAKIVGDQPPSESHVQRLRMIDDVKSEDVIQHLDQHLDSATTPLPDFGDDEELTQQVSSEPLLILRSALWTVGHIGSVEHGWKGIIDCDADDESESYVSPCRCHDPTATEEIISTNSSCLVGAIQYIACHAASLALRGTAWYALGLLSLTEGGRVALSAHGWHTPIQTVTGASACRAIAIPSSRSPYFTLPTYDYISWACVSQANPPALPSDTENQPADTAESKPSESSSEKASDAKKKPVQSDAERVLLEIGNLGNFISTDEASTQLKRMHSKKPDVFKSSALFFRAAWMLERYKFRLPVRQFVYDLFSSAKVTPADYEQWAADCESLPVEEDPVVAPSARPGTIAESAFAPQSTDIYIVS